MTRNRFTARDPMSRPIHRFASVPVVVSVVWALLLLGPSAVTAADPIRIAVAPFAGPEAGPEANSAINPGGNPAAIAITAPNYGKRVAEAIVDELRKRPLDRLIAPDDFVADARLDPSAEEVRRWAYNAAVETVIVGRILAVSEAPEDALGQHRIEIVVRSGHSGAELARHHRVVASPRNLSGAGAMLASAILEDLDYSEPSAGEGGQDSLHTVGLGPRDAAVGHSGGGVATPGAGAGHGLDAGLDRAGFDKSAPIEIKAEEAEIISGENGRELVFRGNVYVRQANVTLRSDHLEAFYRKGESEPEKLVARGKVYVDQGARRARCDRAVYLREAQQLSCIGHAELVQGCDTVRGESIQFDLQEDRARVEGAASIVIRPGDGSQLTCGSVRGVM
jgi:lipopolysaccharide export system protein LptA